MTDIQQLSELQPIGQKRFGFFDTYGLPNSTSESREAFRQLSVWEKYRLNVNIWAFLFSFMYFFVKGMWRKGLVRTTPSTCTKVKRSASWNPFEGFSWRS